MTGLLMNVLIGRETASDIAAFARDCAQNTVRILGPSDFPTPVLDSAKPWFVDFFAPVSDLMLLIFCEILLLNCN